MNMSDRIIMQKDNDNITKLLHKYLSKGARHILSAPFIWAPLVIFLVLDFFIEIYQFFAFPLYGIPKVNRSDYIKYDRAKLKYLKRYHKINCLYCSYINGLIAYMQEIAGRTEKYWCPLKYANRTAKTHDHYDEFAEYGDEEGFKNKYNYEDVI